MMSISIYSFFLGGGGLGGGGLCFYDIQPNRFAIFNFKEPKVTGLGFKNITANHGRMARPWGSRDVSCKTSVTVS